MDFGAFDTSKMDEYAKRAKETWGSTPEYKEFEEKTRDRTPGEQQSITEQFKATDQIGWVRRMNSIRSRAEEVVKSYFSSIKLFEILFRNGIL